MAGPTIGHRARPRTQPDGGRRLKPTIMLLAGVLALTLITSVRAQEAPTREHASCADGTLRLVSFHYVVDGTRHDRLEGRVGPGDVFTLVASLQACGSKAQLVAMEFEMPPCQGPQGDQRLNGVEDLNSADVTDDAEPAMLQDMRAALSCDPVLSKELTSAAIVAVTVGAIGTLVAMFAIRRG